jgi:hypothetical protein
VGGHPGVEFLDNGEVIGEADLLLLFRDGSSAIGEYKRTGAGLTDPEIAKLDRLATRVGADWTLVATHDLRANCATTWRQCQARLPARPRLALCGERLLAYPLWTLGSDPSSWDDDPERGRPDAVRVSPDAVIDWWDELRHPDSHIRIDWQSKDARPSTDS